MWSGNEVGLQEKYSRALFVPEMVKDGSITESVFSFHLSGLTGQSYLDFGTPNPAAMKGDPSEIIYIPNQSNQVYWQNEVTGFRFTSNADNTADQAFTKADALTDTGASCISGPSSDVEKITDGIWSAIGKFTTVESSSGWGQQFSCAGVQFSDLPSFELLFGGRWFLVDPEDYVIEFNTFSKKCSICFTAGNQDYWILGDVFLRGWYAIHDFTNQRMGFIPQAGTTKTTPTTGSIEVDDGLIAGLEPEVFWFLVGVMVFVVFTVLLIVAFCFELSPIKVKKQLQQILVDSSDQQPLILVHLQ